MIISPTLLHMNKIFYLGVINSVQSIAFNMKVPIYRLMLITSEASLPKETAECGAMCTIQKSL